MLTWTLSSISQLFLFFSWDPYKIHQIHSLSLQTSRKTGVALSSRKELNCLQSRKDPKLCGSSCLVSYHHFSGLTLQGTEEPQQFFNLLCLGPHPPLTQHSLCGGRDTQFKFLLLTQPTKSIKAHNRSTAL